MRTLQQLGIALFLLLSVQPALAQVPAALVRREEREQRPGIQADSERLVVYFAGGAWKKANAPGRGDQPLIEGLTTTDAPDNPTWFAVWRANLIKVLQPSALANGLGAHPLLRAVPQVLVLDMQGHSAPVRSDSLTWSQLACPDGEPGVKAPTLQVDLQVLEVADDGRHRLGLDLRCLQAKTSTLLRAARLLVDTDSQGKVLRAQGMLLDLALRLAPRPPSDRAVVLWPLQPVAFERARPAHWPASPGGWCTQVQLADTAQWYAADALPGAEGAAAQGADDAAPAAARRAALWLDAEGLPRTALFQGALAATGVAPPRLPIEREGLVELSLPEVDGVVLLQRIGLRAGRGQSVGASHLAFTDAGYAAWHLHSDGSAQPVAFALPRLSAEGLWHCQQDGTEDRLRCHFESAGMPGTSLPEDVLLRWKGAKGLVVVPSTGS